MTYFTPFFQAILKVNKSYDDDDEEELENGDYVKGECSFPCGILLFELSIVYTYASIIHTTQFITSFYERYTIQMYKIINLCIA